MIERYVVFRPEDEVEVAIMRNKIDGTYSFVNFTKNHICSCRFNSIDNAVKDMDKQIALGKIIKYIKIN